MDFFAFGFLSEILLALTNLDLLSHHTRSSPGSGGRGIHHPLAELKPLPLPLGSLSHPCSAQRGSHLAQPLWHSARSSGSSTCITYWLGSVSTTFCTSATPPPSARLGLAWTRATSVAAGSNPLPGFTSLECLAQYALHSTIPSSISMVLISNPLILAHSGWNAT